MANEVEEKARLTPGPLRSSDAASSTRNCTSILPRPHAPVNLDATPALMDEEANPCLAAALRYCDLGLSVIPIWPRTKKPIVPWCEFQTRRAEPDEIRNWFSNHPDAGVGIVTGPISNLVVLDIDDPHAAGLGPLPPSPVVRTNKGEHRWYAYPNSGRHVTGKVGFRPGMDCRADRNFVMAPPSLHPSGTAYRWADSCSIEDVDPSACPQWILDEVSTPPRDAATPHPHSSRGTGEARNAYAFLASPSGGVPGEDDGRSLTEWAATPELASRAAPLLGIPAECATESGMGRTFRCVLPGHSENTPSASLYRGKNGVVMYRDWHQRDGREWYFLAEVRASRAHGRVVKLSDLERGCRSPELALWTRRLLVETGLQTPAEVPMRQLPDGVAPSVRRVYDGFRLLLGCKWLHKPGEPTTFSWRFAATWCGVSERLAGEAMHELLKWGIIRSVGKHRAKKGWETTLFLPGDTEV